MLSKEYRGEIWSNVDARVLAAMAEANEAPVCGCVGGDSYSLRAIETVQGWFHGEIHAIYAINGTGANMIAMKAMLDRYSAVICAEETHVNVYEAGAFEYTLGNKLLIAESENGKLSPEGIARLLRNTKKYKYNPKVIAITQPTELGTLYTLEELKALCDYAHSLGMYVYIDGARIGNAVAALGTTLAHMIEYADVDAFTVGGTKAGAMFGEMVVFRRGEFARALPYLQKQSFQHFDKSKFLGAQFCRLFEGDLWLENARAANSAAKALAEGFRRKGITPRYPVEANAVFVPLDGEQTARLAEKYDFHYWNEEEKTVRFITTANTSESAIEALLARL